MPGRDLLGQCGWLPRIMAFPSFGTDQLDPDMKPMSQDSFSGGFEFQLAPIDVAGRELHPQQPDPHDRGRWPAHRRQRSLRTTATRARESCKKRSSQRATTPFKIPKPKRQYDALQVSLNRRFSGNWFVGGNYVLSRLYGNYAGIASSDEIRTPGFSTLRSISSRGPSHFRPGGNANRAIRPRRNDVGRARQPRSEGPSGDRSAARPEAVRRVHGAVRHADRAESVRRQRHAADDRRQNASTPPRSSPKAVATWAGRRCWRRPTCCSRTSSDARLKSHAVGAERPEPVQPEDGSASFQLLNRNRSRGVNQSGTHQIWRMGYDYSAHDQRHRPTAVNGIGHEPRFRHARPLE